MELAGVDHLTSDFKMLSEFVVRMPFAAKMLK